LVWKDCGYWSLTEDGKKVSVVLKRQRYVVNLEEAKAVLEGKHFGPIEVPQEEKNLVPSSDLTPRSVQYGN